MARLRVGGVEASAPPTTPRLRLGGVEASGAAPTATRLRIGGAEASGAVAVVLAAIADLAVEPLTPLTLTAVPAVGAATPDTYTWRRVSGATVTLSTSGATVNLRAPAHLDGTFVVLGVRGTKDGIQSAEVQVRIDTTPQQLWEATAAGWVAVPPPVSL